MNKILLLDDEPEILNALKRLCRSLDCEALTASCGEEGLEIVDSNDLQLVVADHHMIGMTGIEFLQEVKKRSPRTIRMILTGDMDKRIILEALNRGEVYRFATKPWNNHELTSIIKQCLDKYELEEENRRLQKQVEELIKVQTVQQMTITLSHEINNPMTALGGNIELLMELNAKGLDPDKANALLEKMFASWKQIRNIMVKLQNIREVKTVEYVEGSYMIDASESK